MRRWLLPAALAGGGSATMVVVVLLVAVVMAFADGDQPDPAANCGSSGGAVSADVAGVPAGPIAGYSGEQLVNAALIVNAGRALGLSLRGQQIGVMTAMGESTLRVIDYGDGAGPDSRGLFQQRANGAWGSYSDRMNPTISATNFFRALQRVTGWETLSPTEAAHRTQRNADPNHYTRYWPAALQVVAAVSGSAVAPDADPNAGAVPCSAEGGGDIAPPANLPAGSWVRSVPGRVTSEYGMRWGRPHNGMDFGSPCGTPMLAAAAGVVTRAGPSSGYGNLIVIDHGGGIVTRYAHMFPGDLLVRVGQQVTAGQQIARVGTYGDSTGCHLHFEVMVGGAFTNPRPYLTARGVQL